MPRPKDWILTSLQLIELWETFLMQLDADEDGEPFFRPPAVTTAPIGKRDDQPHINEQERQQRSSDEGADESQAGQVAPTTAVVEQAA